jgi:hypothetical protein
MAAMSDYLEGQIRAHIFRTASFTKPAALHIGLFTGAPSDSGGGTEVAGGAYARVARAPLDANWTAASSTDGITTNAAAIVFPAPTANWGTVSHFAIFDASSGGNMLFHGELSQTRVINNGDAAPEFAAGALSITFN